MGRRLAVLMVAATLLAACNRTIPADRPPPTLQAPNQAMLEFEGQKPFALRTSPESIPEKERRDFIKLVQDRSVERVRPHCTERPFIADTLISYTVLQIMGVDSDIILNVNVYVTCRELTTPVDQIF